MKGCWIKVLYTTTGGTTYYCVTHKTKWDVPALSPMPIACPKGDINDKPEGGE